MIFKVLSGKLKVHHNITSATFSRELLDGRDHGVQGVHSVCGMNKHVLSLLDVM